MQKSSNDVADAGLKLRPGSSNETSKSGFDALGSDDSRLIVLDYHHKTFEFIRLYILKESGWEDFGDLLTLWQHAAEESNGVYCNTLPLLSCLAFGGNAEQAIPLSASWSLYYLAARMLDDLQDQDKDDMPWSQWPAGKTLPIALGALFAAQYSLACLGDESQTVSEIQRNWSQSFFLSSRGQAIIHNDDLSTYFERTTANTGLMFGAACWGGARLVTSDLSALQTMQEFGIALGMTIQLGNDLANLDRDLKQRHLTLAPLLAEMETEHPQNQRLRSLLYGEFEPTKDEIDETIEILESTGAQRSSLQVARTYQAKAFMLLDRFANTGGDIDHLRTYTTSLLSRYNDQRQS